MKRNKVEMESIERGGEWVFGIGRGNVGEMKWRPTHADVANKVKVNCGAQNQLRQLRLISQLKIASFIYNNYQNMPRA